MLHNTMDCVANSGVDQWASYGPAAVINDARRQTGELSFLDCNGIYTNIHCGQGNLATSISLR